MGRRERSAASRAERTTRRTRRRFARRQWQRRFLAWKPVLAGVVVLGLLSAGVWLVWFSSVLTLRGVSVEGAGRVGDTAVLSAAAVPTGGPLARVDTARVERRVGALDAVRSVEVHRHWPHGLVIDVQPRVPVAVVEIGGRLRSLDADGVVFGTVAKSEAGSLPRVETVGAPDSQALAEAATVVAAIPSGLARMVDHVDVASIDQITLELRDERKVAWGSARDSATKAEVLAKALALPGSVYDVSVPGQLTVR